MNVTRRDFLRASAAGVAGAIGASSAERPEHPNVIVILADDLGFSDIGCYGSEIATPNLDRLAQRGVRFTQFYNSARCCPSRTALLTGLYNHRAGVGDMVNHRVVPEYQGYLNDRCVTIAEALRPAGYRTAMAGKWHVGEDRPHWPTDRGFEHYFGLISGASSYWEQSPGRQFVWNDKPYTPEPGKFYSTDAFTDHAVQYIDQYARGRDPYFVYLAYTAPHWPLHAWPEDIAKYRGKYRIGWDRLRLERHERQKRMGLVDARWPLTPRDEQVPAWETVKDPDAWDLSMSVYAAQIDRMDQGIGRVLRKVEETGKADNTLILFLADNGGCHEEKIAGEQVGVPPGPRGSFTSYGRPWANASNTPFRLFKHWVHEGGIASPLIASWPAVVKKTGGLHHDPAHIIDVMATCMDVAGAKYPATHRGNAVAPLDGLSLAPTFRGQRRTLHDALFWEHEGNKAVRKGKWKLVSRFEKRTWELYDLDADRSEVHDLAAQEPDRVREMTALYDAWAERCGVVPFERLPRPVAQSAAG
jgi:arylsulfatase A-like enzyme